MEISLMRSRIKIQKSTKAVDNVGNHVLSWTDYHSCSAYANIQSGKEYEAAGQQLSSDTFVFTIRWCKALSGIDSENYRIVFDGGIYNITKVDDFQQRHRTIKLTAERIKR